jgi:hypothetical protein
MAPNLIPTVQTPREAAALRDRKVWQTGVFQSSVLRPDPREMAPSTSENPPSSAVLRD